MFKLLIELFLECIKKENKIMAKLTDVQNEIAALKTQVETEHAEVKAKVDSAVADFSAQIKALKDQIAAGTPATEADLDGLVASIKDVEAAVGTISDEVNVPAA